MTNNEILFYKVFHNVYLFKYIIKSIETTKCDKGDQHTCTRTKFKDIKSLFEMVNKGQFNLLKYKLENNEDIEISIDKNVNGINLLFATKQYPFIFKNEDEKNKFIVGHFKEKRFYRTGDEIKLIENQQNLFADNEIYESNLVQTLLLLLKYKRNQLIEQDMLSFLFKSYSTRDCKTGVNLELIKMVVNEYKLPITLNSLKNAIKYTTPEILEILLSSPSIVQILDEFKNISISTLVGKLMEPMLKYILKNDKLYNRPPKSSNGIDQICGGVSRVNISSVFNLESNSIKNKLIELNYVYDGIGKYKFDGDENKCINHGNFKEIFKFYVKDNEYLYKEYLEMYDEPIDGISEDRLYESSKNSLSANGMKHLAACGYKRYPRRISPNVARFTYKEPFVGTEFLKQYTMAHGNLSNQILDEHILKYLFSIELIQEYQNVYNSISSDCKALSFKWFDKSKLKIKENSIIIDNIECADEIAEHLDYIIAYYKFNIKLEFERNRFFEFENLKVLQYVQVNYPIIFNYVDRKTDIVDGNLNYQYPFSMAIKNCDIELLKQFNELQLSNDGFKQFNVITPLYLNGQHVILPIRERDIIIPFNFDQHYTGSGNGSKLLELLDYLNSTGFKYFTPSLFGQFIKCIGATTNISNLKSLKINFNQFPEETKLLFINSIKQTISPNIISIILNNYNPFSLKSTIGDQKTIYQYWESKLETDSKNTTFYYYGNNIGKVRDTKFINYWNSTIFIKVNPTFFLFTSGDSIQDIKLSIQILFDYLKFDFNNLSIDMVKTISDMVNSLYERLIKIDNISFNQVDEIYKLVSNQWISITGESFNYENTLYHIIYYLSIRRSSFIGLIKSLPSANWIVNSCYKNSFDSQSIGYIYSDYYFPEEESRNGGDIFKFLDPSLYTYEFIFNSPIQTIYKQLIQDLVLSHPNLFKEDHQKIIDSTKEYLEKIGEITLSKNIK